MVEQHGVRQLAHGVAIAVGQHLKDAPLLDRHAFLAQPRLQLSVDFAVGLREQIGEMFGDGGVLFRRFGHGFQTSYRSKMSECLAIVATSICTSIVEYSIFSK